jgi:thioredoxin reductase (NADPH)
LWGADTDSSNRWNLVYGAGARYRRLAVPGIEAFEGNGVYYAATHQEALICGTGPVVVVGGGNAVARRDFFSPHAVPAYTW